MKYRHTSASIFFVLLTICVLSGSALQAQLKLTLNPNEHVCYIGNTMADRMQHEGWLETYLHALHPNHDLTFRNLGYSADEVKTRPRADNFGEPNQWLTKCNADVVFCFFGYNEALRGPAGLPQFKKELAALIDDMLAQKYNGHSAPRLIFCSPIAHENLSDPNLPDGSANNKNLAIYTSAMREICNTKRVTFIDLFAASQRLYDQNDAPLTMNGIHLNSTGDRLIAQEIISQLFGEIELPSDEQLAKLRESVLDKNYHWFSRYRVVDEYNVFGGRSKLAWFGQSNADVMMREMEMFDVMTANRDQRVWAVAKGGDLNVTDSNLPPELAVKPNSESYPYLDPVEAIKKMTVHEKLQVNLFASEKQFPRLINPVQMSMDSDSRLWVSVWESYPHWNPSQPRKDAIVILPDENRDGTADKLIVFADGLNSVTGFEFWGGGILVAALPEIWFLKDTDGDDVADVKIRMLQGMFSADSHHSANAMLIGPDGWLHFSRGIFNTANFETPTKTSRSGTSGVYRFNPRTFEVDFHFPIGPNPHGDSFDRWGYQFANDGTSGTGSYINIGKGVGNKQWFEKRVRPVPANGILSSSHFPPDMDGNFLISNAIGFLGILQLKFNYDGADIHGTEVEPILFSDDPNFRPSDMEIGGDGALYVADWHNSLIGHMQHNMRDPHRDHEHGRIYRVTAKGRDLVAPPKMKGKPIAEVCENFFARENATRYRARLELSGRPTPDTIKQVDQFAQTLDPKIDTYERDQAQALLECLWVHEEHRVPDLELLNRVFTAAEPRVRAAAIRTLGHWHGRIENWESTLLAAARDDAPLVRAEAVKAAVDLGGDTAAQVFLEVATRPRDPELDYVLDYANKELKINKYINGLLTSGQPLEPGVHDYVVVNGSVDELLKLPSTEPVQRAILARPKASPKQLESALEKLADLQGSNKLKLLTELIIAAPTTADTNVVNLGKLLAHQSAADLKKIEPEFKKLALNGATPEIKRLGYATWITAAGPDDAFLAATKSVARLHDFLDAIPAVDESVRGALYEKVQPLIFELPASLKSESAIVGSRKNGVQAAYYTPHSPTADLEVLRARTPLEEAVRPNFQFFVARGQSRDSYSDVLRSEIQITQPGQYTFYVGSDDGSRLYVNDKLLINNDGDHGYRELAQSIELDSGNHVITVVYFNSSGGQQLNVSWQGPDIEKQQIPADRLFIPGDDSLTEIAIQALSSIPGHEPQKFEALAKLLAKSQHRASAIGALLKLPSKTGTPNQVKPLVDNVVSYLSEMPPKSRTTESAVAAMKLARKLAKSLSASEAEEIEKRLLSLDIRVIAIGTVPHRMIYDKEEMVIEAGKPVEFRFSNADSMPHNFAITVPGAMAEIGGLAESTASEPSAVARHYIPKSDKILLGSRLLQSNESQALSFDAPETPGIYPYVCTYPGHWRRMYGALYVVENYQQYTADPEKYLADHPMEIKDELLKLNTRGQQWTFDDLIDDVRSPSGRSFEVGKAAFTAANCIACHKFNNEGQEFGPDLAKLDEQKQTTENILRAIIEPSKDVEEKYSSTMFVLIDGTTISGMVLEENDSEVKIVVDPLAKNSATVIPADDIDGRKKSELSPMPLGMVDRLSREEIIDLIAYIYAKGDHNHPIFEGGHGH